VNQQWFGYKLPTFPGSKHILAVFGIIVFLYDGWVFQQGAFRELVYRTPGMMILI